MNVCEISGLTKTYPAFTLSDVSFSLKSGRICGFIGRNGAGKSTTIKSMLGLVHPDSGDVSYFGLPFSENEREIKSRIGYSTGVVNYYPKKKIRDIVAVTLLRMTVLADVVAYRQNALMTANLCYLGWLLVVFGLFNAVFVGGFFKTAYKFAKPFIAFAVAAFVTVGVAETLIHIPGLSSLNAFGFAHFGVQIGVLFGGALAFTVLTACSMKAAVKDFEKIDL